MDGRRRVEIGGWLGVVGVEELGDVRGGRRGVGAGGVGFGGGRVRGRVRGRRGRSRTRRRTGRGNRIIVCFGRFDGRKRKCSLSMRRSRRRMMMMKMMEWVEGVVT
jgi:hypothetical protein